MLYLCTNTYKHTIFYMNMQVSNEKSFLSQLRELEIGGTIEMPLSRRSYVYSVCCGFGAEWDKRFQTKTDRVRRIISVTRLS